MSDLTAIEKLKLEKLFGMGTGYVLDFFNNTLREFVHDSTGRDLYNENGFYAVKGTSKANRLREFWKMERNPLVGKLLRDLLDYCKHRNVATDDEALFAECQRIADRLCSGAPVEEVKAIAATSTDRSFNAAAKAARDCIERNEPEAGLGHLHTFMVWFVRDLCEKRGITYAKDTALHALFGQYLKHVRAAGLIESDMTDRILKSCIGTLEAFNDVRNNKSLAHANSILNYDEASIVFSHVASAVRFLQALERKAKLVARAKQDE